MKIQDIMTQPATTCMPGDPLNVPAQLMWEHDCGAVPVVDEDGSIVGMITDRDICMAAYTQGSTLQDIPVAEVMATKVFSCTADDSLDAAEKLMSDKKIRRLPVLNGDNRPIGVVSVNDIARYAASSRKKNGVERALTKTLAAICEPRERTEAMTRAEPQAMVQQEAAMN